MEHAREHLQPDDEDDHLSREMAASLAADVAELLELATHLDRRLRHGAGADPTLDDAVGGVAASGVGAAGLGAAGLGAVDPAGAGASGEGELLDAVVAALDDAERSSRALRDALGRAHLGAQRLRDL